MKLGIHLDVGRVLSQYDFVVEVVLVLRRGLAVNRVPTTRSHYFSRGARTSC